jgi:hypothetical protein
MSQAAIRSAASDMLEAFIAGGEQAARDLLAIVVANNWEQPGDAQWLTDELMYEYRRQQSCI